MLRNKRISLIKRPPLIRSSSPTLSDREVENRHPNNKNNKCKKSVRFCDNASLENVRLFYKTEMPIACRADPKCEMKNYIYRLKRPNWPKDSLIRRRTAVVRMEDVQIQKTGSSDDKNGITLLGSVQVANLAFEKQVTVRYTTDDWATYQDVPAQYQEPIAQSANTWDRFGFKIVFNKKQPHHQKLLLAVKYVVNGREFWDNNNKQNYEVDLICDVVLQSSNISNTKKQQQQLLDACPASSDEAVDMWTSMIKIKTSLNYFMRSYLLFQ
ncbi:putative phosphatase regulatory subunit-domain-containing protein [Mycotypha africana]|uniref:putative phosphatase regulatory subunit-domain-containing protein n=1 Tax=Mycotypha africana TaxID=64632 RepID=UPI0022FFEE12|nr:putative phosphatase regulatory subunit-domain-containing protein [Mycotypha africana]KAI8981950.1 putative phosphatase regulatory subunit-domain-containing protein [Mycotypha africana]